MRLAVGYSTDVGRVREGNEDSFLIDEHLGVFAVADGMGGHRGGEVASSTAIEALRAAVAGGQPIDAAIASANTAVLERAAGDRALAGMGTTLTAIQPLAGSRLLVGHVGDSRAYLLRDDALERLTDDHSLVEELVREGRITREQAEVHPQRNIVTRALGVEEQLDVDLLTVTVSTGDRLLICSDGLTSMVREREVARVLGSSVSVQAIADQLVDEAVTNGGEDNVTVVVIDVLEADAPEEPGIPAVVDQLDEPPPADRTAALTAVEAPVAPPADDLTPSASIEAPSQPAVPRRRRRWWRPLRTSALAVLPILVVLAVAAVVLHSVTYRNYYVGTAHGHVAIYNGDVDSAVPFWGPRLVSEVINLPVRQLDEDSRARVTQHSGWCSTDSRTKAEACIRRLRTRSTTP